MAREGHPSAFKSRTFQRWQVLGYEAAGGRTAMELVRFSLCTECEHCPEVSIEADRVKIGEDDNRVILTHAEWNQLVALVQSGKIGAVG
jgi:hypothetical protein